MSSIPLPQYSTVTGHQLINATTLILKEYVSATHVITSMFVLNDQGITRSFYALLVLGREIQYLNCCAHEHQIYKTLDSNIISDNRVPGQNSTRFHGQGGPQYMGP